MTTATQYLWRGLVWHSRDELVSRARISLQARSVTVSSGEMHVAFPDNSVAIFDVAPADTSGVAEVCDLSKETYALR